MRHFILLLVFAVICPTSADAEVERMTREQVVRRAEVVATAEPNRGGITGMQLKAIYLEANWITSPPKSPPDPAIELEIMAVLSELQARGIMLLQDNP